MSTLAPTQHAAAKNAGHRPLLRRYSPFMLALSTLLVSLLVTAWLAYQAHDMRREQARGEFEFQARDKVDEVLRRMATYEQVLRGVTAHLAGSLQVGPAAFRSYVETLGIGERYPGIQGVAIAEVVAADAIGAHEASVRALGFPDYRLWPPGSRETYTAITRIEPFNAMNRRAFGFDMFSEPTRRAAMAAARDSGQPALSRKVRLVQEMPTNVQAGVLMYMPVYRAGMPVDTLAQRRAAILGWVYAPFRIGDFMRALEGARSPELVVTVYDGQSMDDDACLDGCGQARFVPDDPGLRHIAAPTIAGRTWTIDIRGTRAFEQRAASDTTVLVGAGGVVTSLLLAALVWALSSGRYHALSLAMRMTSELRSSRDHIEAEQRRLELILGNSYDAFVSFDPDGRVTYWNTQAERTFGWSAAEAMGKRLSELIIPAPRRAAYDEALAGILAEAGGGTGARRVEVHACRRDGSDLFVEMSVVPVTSDAGPSASAFIRDLTERKQAELREQAHQASLERARKALESTQRLESIGMLTGGVAHDFNNVLQIISGNVQLLLHDLGGAEQRDKRLRSIADAVTRGARLSEQLLAFARRQQLRPQPVSLRALLDNIDDLLKRAVGDGVSMEVDLPGDLWHAQADPAQLENVLLNLAINARDAMDGRGRFTVTGRNAAVGEREAEAMGELQPGQYVVLAVRDTGKGMPPDVRRRAFEPFFTTKPEGKGSGLGLSMAYGFVKQSGGHIEIDSQLGAGTTISIYLPRCADGTPGVRADDQHDGVLGGKGETILVVDDDEAVQDAAASMLQELGYKVLRAHDAERALEVLREADRVDLLFTDVVMPGELSSTDMAKAATSMVPGLPVLFTSGYARNLMTRSSDLVPGATLLRKPYGRQELAFAVRRMLDKAADERAAAGARPPG